MCHINRRRITADGDTSMGTTKFQEFESFVYIDENFPAKNVSELEQNNIEAICIEYTVNKKKNLLCFTYKAPDLDILKCLVGIENILLKTYNDIIFMGDFNCKHVSFSLCRTRYVGNCSSVGHDVRFERVVMVRGLKSCDNFFEISVFWNFTRQKGK